MLRSDKDYKETLNRLNQYENYFKTAKNELTQKGYTEEQAEDLLQPTKLLYEQAKYEALQYERIKRGDIEAISNLEGLGQMLIAARLAMNLSQKDIAERLGVSEAQISKDERHEYAGVSVEKAQKVLQAMGISTKTELILPLPLIEVGVSPLGEEASSL